MNSAKLRVCVAAEASVARLIVESLRVGLPDCEPLVLEPAALATRQLPATDCMLAGPSFASFEGASAVRALRAAGMASPIVVVHSAAAAPDAEYMEFGAMDIVGLDAGPSRLAEAIAAATSLDESSPAVQSLRRAQRLQAMGEVASGLQHAMNNPLTALLAEAQLLEMETLADEHRQAATRMVELSRRLAALVKRLDVVGRAPSMPVVGAAGDDQRA